MSSQSKKSDVRRRAARSLGLAFSLALAFSALPPSEAVAQMPPNAPPVIEEFAVTEPMPGIVVFRGRVTDLPGLASGYTVNFGGAVSGLSAQVRSDETFAEAFYMPGLTGWVTADTTDPEGAAAATRHFKIQ